MWEEVEASTFDEQLLPVSIDEDDVAKEECMGLISLVEKTLEVPPEIVENVLDNALILEEVILEAEVLNTIELDEFYHLTNLDERVGM